MPVQGAFASRRLRLVVPSHGTTLPLSSLRYSLTGAPAAGSST